jgi:hypothetical protein
VASIGPKRAFSIFMSTEKKVTPEGKRILTPEEILEQNERERRWLDENNAVSAVTGGHVEDLQGVPLPADLHQDGRPPAQSAGEGPDAAR